MFRLAEKLGRTVAELERSMSNREYGRWVALAVYDDIEARREQRRAKRKKG